METNNNQIVCRNYSSPICHPSHAMKLEQLFNQHLYSPITSLLLDTLIAKNIIYTH